jgi:hypothetical protein
VLQISLGHIDHIPNSLDRIGNPLLGAAVQPVVEAEPPAPVYGHWTLSAASYTADELPAPGDVIQIGNASANVEEIQPGADGQDVIIAERIDD